MLAQKRWRKDIAECEKVFEEYLRRKGAPLKGDKTIIDGGKYEYMMQFLFDADTDFWMNGPDYIADEYRKEKGL